MENTSNVAFALRLLGLREATKESGEISNPQSFLVIMVLVVWRLASKALFNGALTQTSAILIHRHFILVFAAVPLHM